MRTTAATVSTVNGQPTAGDPNSPGVPKSSRAYHATRSMPQPTIAVGAQTGGRVARRVPAYTPP